MKLTTSQPIKVDQPGTKLLFFETTFLILALLVNFLLTIYTC